jgi:polysaccharide pyruvyl transferase WcaK-like protein
MIGRVEMLAKKRALIYGWFGHENLGDELILKSIVETVKKADSEIIIDVMGDKPKSIIKNHPEVDTVSTYIDIRIKSILRLAKYNPVNVIRNICRADYLIIGSGGALSDWNPESTITLFFMINLFKKILNKPVIMLGVGAGPINKEASKHSFKKVLKQVDVITVRDNESYELLKKIGLDNVELTNDVVFDLKDYFNKYMASSKKVTNKNNRIGMVLAPLILNSIEKKNRYKESIINYIIKCKESGFEVILIPFQYDYDIEFILDIANNANVSVFDKGQENMWSIVEMLNEVDVVIGMRFHSVLVSILLNKPVVPLIYHNKVYSIAKDFELLNISQGIGDGANWLDIDIDYNKLFDSTKEVLNNIKIYKEWMNKRLNEIYTYENIDILKRYFK